MVFTEILTIIFIVLKLCGVITWSWWLVLLPELIAAVIYLALLVFGYKSNKLFNDIHNEFERF